VIGTLGMLLEVSNKGATIDLGEIPHPDLEENNISFEQWVRMYPGMGFILTVNEKNAREVCSRFSTVGMTAKVIGKVDTSKDLKITYEDQESLVFDFSKNGIMRLFTGPGDCI